METTDTTMDIITTATIVIITDSILIRNVIKHTGLPYNNIWEACLYVTEN